MTLWQKSGLVLLLASVLVFGGCKKKPVAPTMTRLPQAPPPVAQQPAPEPAEVDLTTIETAEAEDSSPPDTTAPASTKPRSPRRPAARAAAPAAETSQPATKAVVENGSAPAEPPPAISTRMSQDQATNTRQQTANLLDQTEANLKKLNRELNEQEKAMVQQIRTYVTDSRAATAAGDLVRAQTLALKAHLLSQELVK